MTDFPYHYYFVIFFYFQLFQWDFGGEAGWEVQYDGVNVCHRMEVFLALFIVFLDMAPLDIALFPLQTYKMYSPLLSPLIPPVWRTITFSPNIEHQPYAFFLGSLLKIFWLFWFCLSLSHNFSHIVFSFFSELGGNFLSLSGRLTHH